jgi:hypothetical protein
VVYDSLKTSFGLKHNTPDQDFWILHALRMGEKHERKFLVWEIYYDSKRKGWRNTSLPIPASTGLIKVLGSGAACAQKHIDRWINSAVGGRSSAIFSGFCDALFSGEDKHSGGMPQIGALTPGSHAQMLGFIDGNKHYLQGLQVIQVKTLHRIHWVDRYFQNMNALWR